MFRKMKRIKQAISEDDCIELLKNETRGVLSVIGDGGYPYGVPINHYYDERDGKIYFHGAGEGHRIDAIKANDKVCYTVFDKGYRREGEWALNVRSVIIFGRLRPVSDEKKTEEISRLLCLKFTNDQSYIDDEVKKHLHRTLLLELTIEHMSGKIVNEA